MTLPRLLRAHPYLVSATVFLTALAIWIGSFLANFDLNDYRGQLADRMARQLELPVRLGDARMDLREAGIAFRFSDVQIGDASSRTELRARTLWLQLAWSGLLRGRLIFTEMAFDTPQLRIDRTGAAEPPGTTDDPPFDAATFSEVHVRRIEFQDGRIELTLPGNGAGPRQLSLQELHGTFAGFGLRRPVTIDLAGALSGAAPNSRLTIKGEIIPSPEGSLADAEFDLALEARAFDAARLAAWLPSDWGVAAAGHGTIELAVKGRFDRGATVQLEVSGDGLRVRPGKSYRTLVPLKHLQLAGIWSRSETGVLGRQLVAQFDGVRLSGEVDVTRSPEVFRLDGRLANTTIPVAAMLRWLPEKPEKPSPLLAGLGERGTLTVHEAAFHLRIPSPEEGPALFALETLRGEARQLSWPLGGERSAELAAMRIEYQGGSWLFREGHGTLAGIPVTVAGRATAVAEQPPELDLALAGSAEISTLLALLPSPPAGTKSFRGSVGLQLQAAGPPDRLTVTGRIDLSKLAADDPKHLQLAPTPGAAVALQGVLVPASFQLERADLNLPPLTGTMTGHVDWSGPPKGNLAARLEVADLTGAYAIAPQVQQLGLRGGVALDASLDGPLAGLRPTLSLELRAVEIPTHGIIADITQLSGRIQPDGAGLRSSLLTARLGRSPVQLQARIADLKEPRLELDVKAASVRADELIFRSDRNWLRDLRGTLLIDDRGLEFAPVTVRLDGGTAATVRGSVRNFSAPEVVLDIRGDYAHVEEIIGLWTEESREARAARLARHGSNGHPPLPPVRITAQAREGDLYGMNFHDAHALIVPSADRLLIHPLDFKTGQGYSNAQVLVDHSGKDTLLRVSGHIENVDAYQVYNELLDRKSIMRGTLRGDFYLQGELGSEQGFLPTSYGNVTAEVRDGVMRHFPVISTLFSLLNVSQLFTLQLPDVSSEGVPFTRLSSELTLAKGVLRSEALVIESNALSMSYIGQYDLLGDRLDLLTVVKPLATIDKVVSRLPIAGWILTGENRALVTAQFKVTGPADQPKIEAIPISAMSKGVLGVFQRTLGLPMKLVDDPAILWGGGGKKPN